MVAAAVATTCARPALSLHPHHVRRLEAVVDFVDAHLDADLSLERLAAVAAISPFHFHRLFHLWSGETTNEFVRRRRLDVAAGRLRHCPGEKITAVSLNCGFASPEGFARAFRERFGATPSTWRERLRDAQAHGGDAPRVAVTREPETQVLFMRGRGDFAVVAPMLWERFMSALRTLGLADQTLLFMGLDDPSIAGPGRCRMDACVQLPADFAPLPAWPQPFMSRRIAPRWVARLGYDGPAAQIDEGWRSLLERWLPQAPWQLAIGSFCERYDPTLDLPGSRHVRCELVMPVEPRVG